jgi:hypothetical protein
MVAMTQDQTAYWPRTGPSAPYRSLNNVQLGLLLFIQLLLNVIHHSMFDIGRSVFDVHCFLHPTQSTVLVPSAYAAVRLPGQVAEQRSIRIAVQ